MLESLLPTVVQFLSAAPYVGPYIVMALQVLLPITAVMTALLLCWHALVMLLGAVAQLPGCGGLQKFADLLKHDEDAAETFVNSKVIPMFKMLGAIPVPKVTPAATTTPAA